MKITTFKQSLPFLFKARVSTFVWGTHGIGKSQSVAQYCKENGYMFIDLRLGTQDVGDLLGLADFIVDPVSNQKIATKFMTPDWLHQVMNFCHKNPDKKAIIFLDEINRARRDVLQATFQLVLDNRLHTTQLPDNCHCIAASNPNTEDYIVADVGDKAFMDRFCHITLQPTTAEWFDYAKAKGFDTNLVSFLKDQPDLLQGKTADFSMDEEIKPSRRSWEAVDRLIKVGTPEDTLQELCYGLVGKAATIAFMESLKNSDKPLSALDIIKDFNKHEKKVKDYSSKKDGGRQDLLKHTCEDLIQHYEKSNVSVDKEEATNVISFLKTIPADLMFSTLRKLYLFEGLRNHLGEDEDLIKLLQKTAGKKKKSEKEEK